MTDDTMKYDEMLENAMRGMVRDALQQVAEHGLPGEHHFYITFKTGAPAVEIPSRMRAQYPNEMTIILQHRFWNLLVDETGFSVELSFSGRATNLYIPFAAMTSFVDPSVDFGLQFSNAATPEGTPLQSTNVRDHSGPDARSAEDDGPKGDDGGNGAAEDSGDGDTDLEKVVSLDQFRKK
jgi:hypothetical protein